MEFNGQFLMLDTPEGRVQVSVHNDGTADVFRDGRPMGTLYALGHPNNVHTKGE